MTENIIEEIKDKLEILEIKNNNLEKRLSFYEEIISGSLHTIFDMSEIFLLYDTYLFNDIASIHNYIAILLNIQNFSIEKREEIQKLIEKKDNENLKIRENMSKKRLSLIKSLGLWYHAILNHDIDIDFSEKLLQLINSLKSL